MKAGLRLIITTILLILFLGNTLPLKSQEFKKHHLKKANIVLEGKIHYGFLIDHQLEMDKLKNHFSAFELNIYKATYGRTRWESMYKYPLIGLTIWQTGFAGNKYLGSCTAIYPFINFPLVVKKNRVLYFKLGVGLGYISNSFDAIDNYQNIAIGSNLNAALNFSFEGKIRLFEQLLLSGGISLSHFSNGSIKTPNFGINFPTITLGVGYHLNKENPFKNHKLLPMLYPFEFDGRKYIQLYVTYGIGLQNMQADFGQNYHVSTIFANLFKRLNFKNKIGLGLDLIYESSDRVQIDEQIYPDISSLSLIKTGFNIAYELEMSRVSMVFNVGAYLYARVKSDGNFYEKLALRILVTDHIFTNITLKANGARADYISLGLGYKFNLKHY